MRRKPWIALVALVFAAGISWGCGDTADGPVERSEAAVKGDQAVQEAMKSLMESKKGAKKGAAKKEEPKAGEAPAAEAKAD